MVVAAVAQIPVTSRLVPGCLEHMINKKVANVALSLFERIVDFILSWIYCPYSYLYLGKLSRVHYFSDGTPLFDCTKDGIASITNGRVSLIATQIYFEARVDLEVFFSRANRTEYVVVEEDPRFRPGWIQVVEQEMDFPDKTRPKEKLWSINTNEAHRYEGVEPIRDFFLANPIR